MYKVHNEIVPDPIIVLFDKTETMHKYSTRSMTNQNYCLKRTDLNKVERGISVAAVKVWNDLFWVAKKSCHCQTLINECSIFDYPSNFEGL